MIYNTYYESPIGNLMLASRGETLIGLWMRDQKYFAATVNEEIVENNDLPIFIETKKWLDRYFAGQKPKLTELALEPEGTDFRKEVWDILCEIEYGELLSYGDIAKRIAQKRGKKTMSAQAVGGAVGHNPISVIIPCHRVVGSDGSLTGFSGGLEKKIKLLELENIDMDSLYKPKKGTAL